MFLWFFVMPELLPKAMGDWIKQMPPPLSRISGRAVPRHLHLGHRGEQVKAGIQSLPRGQSMPGPRSA